MKEYKYKVNGNRLQSFRWTMIENNIAHVEVNGILFIMLRWNVSCT